MPLAVHLGTRRTERRLRYQAQASRIAGSVRGSGRRRESNSTAVATAATPIMAAANPNRCETRVCSARRKRSHSALEREPRLADISQPSLWILFQTPVHDIIGARCILRQQMPVWVPGQNCREHGRHVFACESRPARQHLKQDAAKRPNVRSFVHGKRACLFGAHVRRCSYRQPLAASLRVWTLGRHPCHRGPVP